MRLLSLCIIFYILNLYAAAEAFGVSEVELIGPVQIKIYEKRNFYVFWLLTDDQVRKRNPVNVYSTLDEVPAEKLIALDGKSVVINHNRYVFSGQQLRVDLERASLLKRYLEGLGARVHIEFENDEYECHTDEIKDWLGSKGGEGDRSGVYEKMVRSCNPVERCYLHCAFENSRKARKDDCMHLCDSREYRPEFDQLVKDLNIFTE